MLSRQLTQIKTKLDRARKNDPGFEQFGSDHHRYELNDPLSAAEVAQFESRFKIQLPLDYVAFITTLGHGGPGHFGGAGPYYGLYKLNDFGYMVGCKATLDLPCVIHSGLTPQQWNAFTAFDKSGDASNRGVEFDRKYDMLFSGLLPIGTQGDSYQTMMILNGDDRGRVVNIDQDLSMPRLALQENFLDWYEHWLDGLLERSR